MGEDDERQEMTNQEDVTMENPVTDVTSDGYESAVYEDDDLSEGDDGVTDALTQRNGDGVEDARLLEEDPTQLPDEQA